jgi:putative transposase
MFLGFKTQLKVTNPKVAQALAKHCGVARHAYNWGLSMTLALLEHNRTNPEDKIKFPSAIDLHKALVALVKPENPWYYEVSKCAPQYALGHLREGWKRCFNKQGGVPRFKKKYKQDSFTLDGAIKVDHFKIKIPVIGWLKTYERLPQGLQPKSVTISRKADRWYISFKIEIQPQTNQLNQEVVGVDLGVSALATLSTGDSFPGVKAYRKLEKKLANLQRKSRQQVIGSANWRKSQGKIASLHQRIANQRKDYLHKTTTYIAKNHGTVVIEDLNVSGMLANHKLAKAISDGAFYEIRRQLSYKCELYGSKLILAPRFYPSSKKCHCCGEVKENLTLAERIFECENCGWIGARDLNAALNLEAIVRATPKFTPVDKKEPTPLVEAGIKTLKANYHKPSRFVSRFE